MAEKYTDLVANAYKEIKMWRMVAVLLGTFTLILAVLFINKGLQESLILVPFEIGTSGALDPSRKEIVLDKSSISDEYLRYVALADLGLIMNWNPQTIMSQYGQFLNRTTPELYAKSSIELLAEADRFAKSSNSQVFYPHGKISADKNTGTVIVEGKLIRWTGEKKVFDDKVKLNLKYTKHRGILYVSELTIG